MALALLSAGGAQAAPPQDGRRATTEPVTPAAKAERQRKLPFSGLDLALLTAGGGPLLLIGASLRRHRAAPKVKPAQQDLTPA